MGKSIQSIGLAAVLAIVGLLSCLTFFTRESLADGGVWCVVPPGEPVGPYVACDQVFTSIQAAVDTAVAGDEVWVAAGVYTDIHTLPLSSWTQMVFISKTLTLRGGYLPPFTTPPDATGNATILDAQGQGLVFHLLTPGVTIEGFHVTGGSGAGGGVKIVGGTTATLTNNLIYGNGVTGNGGGVMIAGSRATLSQNQIYSNVGQVNGALGTGGGLIILNSHVDMQANIIFSNTAVLNLTGNNPQAYGGGIYVSGSTLTMTENLVQGNTAAFNIGPSPSLGIEVQGGGLYMEDSDFLLHHNQIRDNTAVYSTTSSETVYGRGGGIALLNTQGSFRENEVTGNRAAARTGSGYGGGLSIAGQQVLTITDNLIQANVAAETSSSSSNEGTGGGMLLSLSLLTPEPSFVTLAHNTIRANSGAITGSMGLGGGVAILSDNFGPTPPVTVLHMVDNDISGNTGLESGLIGAGGGIFIGNANGLHLDHNQIVSNTAAINGTEFGLGGGLYTFGQNQRFENNLILENIAAQTGAGYGGGVGVGNESDLLFINTVLNDNEASTGGSALATIGADSHVSFQHTTIARHQGSDGVGIWVSGVDFVSGQAVTDTTLAMTNTILVSYTTGIRIDGGHTAVLDGILWFNTPTTVSAAVTATVSSANALTGDPAFASDGYHLTAPSAARGQGVPAGILLDIDNEGRPFPPALGADEYWPFKLHFPIVRHD